MSAIGVGDLVMMVRRLCDCADCRAPLGIPFVVRHIAGVSNEPVHCATNPSIDIGYAPVARGFGTYNIPVSALKKIEPPPADEDVTSTEEIAA